MRRKTIDWCYNMRHTKLTFKSSNGEEHTTYASDVGLVWVDGAGRVEVLWYKWNYVEQCDSLMDGIALIQYNGVL